MPVYIARDDYSAAELRLEARAAGNGRESVRLLLIANLLDGMEREEAAAAVGLSAVRSYEWVHRYEEEGVAGLRDRPRRGRRPRLDEARAQAFKARIVAGADLERDGVVAFRGLDAQRILREEFGVEHCLSSVYLILHQLQLSRLVPRPLHRKSDAQSQEAFRKRQGCNSAESGAPKRPANESKSGSRTKPGSVKRTS